MKKLTEKQREKAITEIIENDMTGFYKGRDIFDAFYYGIEPYKNMTDEAIIEWYEERELDLPKA